MGLIRKTTSIATLGVVPFRSRKERLRRAERAARQAGHELAVEQERRTQADRRVAAAERRAHQAELVALHEARTAEKAKRRARRHGGGRRGGRGRTGRDELEELVQSATPILAATGRRARRRGKVLARQAREAGAQAGRTGRRLAGDAAERAATAAERTRERLEA